MGPTTPLLKEKRFRPLPRSLAATKGISVDFSSSGYLDVSVPQVRSSYEVTALANRRVAPFGHLGISACVPLPRAFRSLPRPSSPPCAQASPTCLRLLDYKTPIAKQSTRDLSTSDNLAKVSQFRFAIPRSTTNFRCQTATPSAARVRGSLSNRNGNWMSRRATIRYGFPSD